ncbi:SafA/ExsA family spore coat assembly protein [Lutibacter sp. B2]|nr:SafA/ExsA family spore coat assembly protein [Lutibacter sp. B2]
MKKIFSIVTLTFLLTIPITAQATTETYTVVTGDSLWKIAQKYQVGLSEIIAYNDQIKNPNLIYPNMKINIPEQEAGREFEKEVVRLVNVERQKNGLSSLKENWQLSRVARYKSNDMKNKDYFSHTSPTYGSPFDMMKNFGIQYSYAGENIAKGQKTPQQVMNGWMNSSGHRANILSKNFTEIGVGYTVDQNGTTYWTQMFIKP